MKVAHSTTLLKDYIEQRNGQMLCKFIFAIYRQAAFKRQDHGLSLVSPRARTSGDLSVQLTVLIVSNWPLSSSSKLRAGGRLNLK